MGLNLKFNTSSKIVLFGAVLLGLLSGVLVYLGFHILINQFWNLEPVETFLVFWFTVFIVEKFGKK